MDEWSWTCSLIWAVRFVFFPRIAGRNANDQWSRLNRRNQWRQQTGQERLIREIQQYSRKDEVIVGNKKVTNYRGECVEAQQRWWRVDRFVFDWKIWRNRWTQHLCRCVRFCDSLRSLFFVSVGWGGVAYNKKVIALYVIRDLGSIYNLTDLDILFPIDLCFTHTHTHRGTHLVSSLPVSVLSLYPNTAPPSPPYALSHSCLMFKTRQEAVWLSHFNRS